jgi:hypothetical protein
VRFDDAAAFAREPPWIGALPQRRTAVLRGHQDRRSNTGAADWLVTRGRLAITYNHPDEGDDLAALVVTLWRRA